MKLTLIQPSMGKIEGAGYVKSWQMEPLSIAVIAGMTPEDVEIKFYDDRFDEIPFDEPTDLVGMPIETYTAKRTYNIASQFRERGVPVVMGGIHAGLIPEEVMEYADATLVGDAEGVWEMVINDAKKGKLQKVYKPDREKRGILPHTVPRRDLFDSKPYINMGMVETGRGCPFKCDFCAIAGAYDGAYNSKTVKEIVDDVEAAGSNLIYFVDDNFVSKFSRTKELCKAMAPLNVKWFSHGSINMAHDTELLKSLEKSGCANILIGFESLNSETLKAMGKSWNKAKMEYDESIKRLRDHGITIYATFVFGYDNDTPEDFERTLDFAIEKKFALAAFNHLVPYPGTPLYHSLKKQGRLFEDKWWLRDGFRFGEVAFQPKNFSAKTLEEICFELRNRFYSYNSILKRQFDFKANSKNLYQSAMSVYANLVSKKGVAQRQHWPLG